MTQQLHDFGPFLLGLPPPVRRRIYLYLGVAPWDGCPMVLDLNGPVNPFEEFAFHGLLLSCRVIYGEVSALLFSANRFIIHYRVDQSLQPLRNLTASSLASLTSLKIVLNQNSCHHRREGEGYGKCCDDPILNCQRRHRHGHHDRPLQSPDSSAGPMLDEWLRTAGYLSSRLTPRALELSLVCDLDQEEADAAAQVVAPLSLLPELKNCHVRLCRVPNAKLGQIAQSAALQACRRAAPEPPESSSSRLLSLPRELRLRILEYTDLVIPWGEVIWSRLQRGYQYPAGACLAEYNIPCPPVRHHGCQYWGCEDQAHIEGGLVVYYDSIGCFCRLRHAAFSSTCRCWAPPTPLFLICRALLEDARFVFFSVNRFVVSDTLASRNPFTAFSVFRKLTEWRNAQPPRSYPAERVAASQFLREVVPAGCLGHLRSLELVFPPYNHNFWPQDGHPALQDWAETVDWVKDKINTRGITLRLTMAGSLSTGCAPVFPDGRTELTQEQGDQVLAGYNRILAPLAHLGGQDGLARFYADFAWPWKWTNWAYDRRKEMGINFDAWTRSEEAVLNERAERFILGSGYEPRCQARGERDERHWKMRYTPPY